jgi:hypothetical protein
LRRYSQPVYATAAQLKDTTSAGRQKYEGDLRQLLPFQKVTLDYAVWVARCTMLLDDTFALVDEMAAEAVPVKLPANATAYRCVAACI